MTGLSVVPNPFPHVRLLTDVSGIEERQEMDPRVKQLVKKMFPWPQPRTSSFLALPLPVILPGKYAYRPIPLAESGISEGLHKYVEAVWGNTNLQSARHILIADTDHDDEEQETNIMIFATTCLERGYVLLREATPLFQSIPNEARASWFNDIEDRDACGIRERGWDDAELYFYGITYKRLLKKYLAKDREYRDCHARGKKLLSGSNVPSQAECDSWTEESARLKQERDELEKRKNQAKKGPDPFFADERTKCLKRALDQYYKEGCRVVAVAGSNHFPPKLLAEIAIRGVIIVILKGKPLTAQVDQKSK